MNALHIPRENLPQLTVRVKQLDAPREDLLSSVPVPGSLACWLGEDLEIVGWGAALKLEFEGRHAAREAARDWDYVAANARVSEEDANTPKDEAAGSAPGSLESKAPAPHWPLALGSFGFASSTPGYLVVPESALIQRGGKCWVMTASTQSEPADPAEVLEAALGQDAIPISRPAGLWTDPGRMTQSKWKEAVRRLIVMLQAGAASKVVLTRDLVVSASKPVDDRFLVNALLRRYGTTWIYAVEGLVGATPEMLTSLKDEQFVSRVLAGTSAPGDGEKLLASIKDRTEHHLAVESVARAIAPLSETLEVPADPELLELPNVTHLSTELRAVVRDSNVLDVVDALHPTAAVCGTPTSLAFNILEDIEGTQRGRYTGPVGWIDGAGDGEFGIALRCGQLSDDRKQIRVFAGGGIMPDSNPDLELAETRAKMRPVLEALELER